MSQQLPRLQLLLLELEDLRVLLTKLPKLARKLLKLVKPLIRGLNGDIKLHLLLLLDQRRQGNWPRRLELNLQKLPDF